MLRSQLLLVPYVTTSEPAGKFLTTLAAVTFTAFTVAFPVACSWAMWQGEDRSRLAPSVEFLVAPLRFSWWSALWVGPVGFGRKLLFAALVAGSQYDRNDASLPLMVFVSLLGLLVLQVRVWQRRHCTTGDRSVHRWWCVPTVGRATTVLRWCAC